MGERGKSSTKASNAIQTSFTTNGCVDLIKTGHGDCPVEAKILGMLYNKFKDENGLTNVHLAYQAAWFIDWWCLYARRDMGGNNYNVKTKSRTNVETKTDYKWYRPYNGYPPGPFRTGFCDHAWQAFWISKI